MDTLKEKIIDLRSKGYTYNAIVVALNCSKSLVCYYCNSTQKDKSKKRRESHRQTLNGRMSHRLSNFFRRKTLYFRNSSKKGTSKIVTHKFTAEDVFNKIGENPVCYLTGTPINLMDSKSYQFDHIIPVARGGDNSLENLEITITEANMAKGEMGKHEFINLCMKVLIHAGYEIKKPT